MINKSMPTGAKLAHPIITTTLWGSTRSVIALYGFDDPADPNIGFNKILGHVYCPTGKGSTSDSMFGPIDEDGGYPEVISVFFANADKDKVKELVVLCRYKQQHHDYNGDFFETFIYDNPGPGSTLTYLEKLSEKFFGCECTYTDGKVEKALYKNAESIKAKLKKMGYSQ
ncbi:hypothetical protein [Fibrella arboris]|uniref:hypothetical protein n=1 Tax=Fibrella arboris TaxID=3242486 RepID=UPI003522A4B9